MAEIQKMEFKQLDATTMYVKGAKDALNYRGFDDYMVYYTLLSMGVPIKHIDHLGKDERNKRYNKMELKKIKE
tara:strand:- start:523 stop:741 length:219 start_codon:yes stop_codon:yes gene_type:complete